MPRIGNYRTRVVREIRATAKEAKYGQAAPTWTDGDTFWSQLVEGPANPIEADAQRISLAVATIRIRGVVELESGDRLRVKVSGDVYEVLSVHYGFNETVATVERYTVQ